jgi:hypothetical protein
MPSSVQCAVGTDGKLLDESEIVWYNDAEDSIPIAPFTQRPSDSAPSTSSAPKATTLHTFFKGGSTPAIFVAGGRRSSRVSKPSKRILDANNAEPAHAETSKRARIARKKAESESDPEDSDASESEDEASAIHASNAGADTDVEMDSITAEDAYALTKAMGDQDRKVFFF